MKCNLFLRLLFFFFISTVGILMFILAKVSELESGIKKMQTELLVLYDIDSFEVEGKVLDSDNTPLKGAVILIDSIHQQVSNGKGEYNFKIPFKSDLISISAEKDGFAKSTFSISVDKNKKTTNDIFLMSSN